MSARGARRGERGQILALFALVLFVLVGMVAVVIDVAWIWSNSLKIQRASDAAALAGVVQLPGNPPGAYAAAAGEATKNGYTNGVDATSVVARQDPNNARRLLVTISAPVETFFARLFGFTQFQITQSAKAEYALPVPMGSPQNYYGVMVMRTPGSTGVVPVIGPDGRLLASQGFWGTAISQGADKLDGDPFLAKWDPAAPGRNTEYEPNDYHNYAIELAPNTVDASVWVFDAPFCATDGRAGTGDRWLSGMNPVSTFYSLFDTNGTPADYSDDSPISGSGNLFRRVHAADSDLGAGVYVQLGAQECRSDGTLTPSDPRYWHNRWWPVADRLSAGPAGRTLRLHVTTTDASASNDQNATDGHNNFAIAAHARAGADPKVYGLGAMGAYFAVPGGGASEFFMAQIDAAHAGKTMVIELYDPGDTGTLMADFEILEPTATGYRSATFSWRSDLASTSANASRCDNQGVWFVNRVVTNTGSANNFNGCWLTVTIPLDAAYTAPNPPGAPGAGWWKIRYNMAGDRQQTSHDLTAWRVSLIGSPVHLVP